MATRAYLKAGLAVAVAGMLSSTAASAQEVLMRRPLPRTGTSPQNPTTNPTNPTPTPTPGPGGTPTPSPTPGGTPTPSPTPTTPDEPYPVWPTNPGPVNPVDDPVKTLCDDANSANAHITDVQWIEAGWTQPPAGTQSCGKQTMQYTCQATYTCSVNGAEKTFVSEAPDSTCENYDGKVGEPPTSYPSTADIDAQAKWVASKLASIASANASVAPTGDWQKPAGFGALAASSWVRSDMIFYYDSWYTNGRALRVYFNTYPWEPFCQAFAKYSGKQCDNYGQWGTWVYYK